MGSRTLIFIAIDLPEQLLEIIGQAVDFLLPSLDALST
jgi:hypothetical protein